MKITFTAAALVAVLAAGCGAAQPSSHSPANPTATAESHHPLSKAAYSLQLQHVGKSLVAALNTLGQKPTDFKRIETNVGRGQAALKEAAARLAAITPPSDARSDNSKFVSGMRYFAAQLTKLKTAASHHNLQAVIASDRNLDRSPVVTSMIEAAADLQHKGYKLGQLAPSRKS